MCGFVGFTTVDYDAEANLAIVRDMADRIKHRGPDDDGYYVNEWGEWVANGQVVTKGYQNGMQVETDYSKVGGNYNTTRQIYSNGSTNYYNPGDFPVTVGYSNGQCYVTSYFGNNESTTEWFSNYNTQYSYESSDHTKLLDFIDANNFRIVDSNQGTETYFSR